MKEFGIKLLPPDVNKSKAEFSIEEKGKIRFGLARIKNVGESSAKEIVKERERNGDYQDIFDISERLDSKVLNKRVLEALIKAGAFDFTQIDRGIMLSNIDKALTAGQKHRESKKSGQNSLLGLMMQEEEKSTAVLSYNEGQELTEREKLDFEKEVLGFYITGHPLRAYQKELKGRVLSISSLINKNSKDRVKIAGVISNVKKKKTRNGNTMITFQIEDETGIIDVRAFPENLEDSSTIDENKLVILEGSIEINEEQESVSMNANTIIPIERINNEVKYVRFILSKEDVENGLAEKIKEICQKHRGNKEVIVEIYDKGNFWCEIAAHTNYHVEINDEFKQELTKLLPPEKYIFE
jgi:DNA polymerase-3 subunit alpha